MHGQQYIKKKKRLKSIFLVSRSHFQ